MKNKSLSDILNLNNSVLSIEDFKDLENNDNIKLIKFVGAEYKTSYNYQISKYALMLSNNDVIVVYEDVPTI